MKFVFFAVYFGYIGYQIRETNTDEKIISGALKIWDELQARSARQFLDEADKRRLSSPCRHAPAD